MGQDKSTALGKAGELTINAPAPHVENTAGNDGSPRRRSPKLLQQPSPTAVIGRAPHFTVPNESFLHAIRLPTEPTAFHEPGTLASTKNSCYRNAVVIMLLTTRPFMSYIQNRHEPETKSVIASRRESGDRIDVGDGKSVRADRYSNLLLELNKLYQPFWAAVTSQKCQNLRRAMSGLVDYMKAAEVSVIMNQFFTQFPDGKQRDVLELLEWFLTLCHHQLQQTSLFAQDADDFKNVYQLEEALTMRCRGCAPTKPAKHRKGSTDPVKIWRLSLQFFDSNGDKVDRTEFDLEELLKQWHKQHSDAWWCPACDAKWKKDHANLHGKEYKDAMKEREMGNPDWQWHTYMNIPEVIFMTIGRFEAWVDGMPPKDNRPVAIPERIDLADYFDTAIPEDYRRLTQYRLRGVIMHAGGVVGGVSHGHYINYLRATDDQWWYVDQYERGERITFDDVNEVRYYLDDDKVAFTPYILCWERRFDENWDGKVASKPPLPAAETTTTTATATATAADAQTTGTSRTLPNTKRTSPRRSTSIVNNTNVTVANDGGQAVTKPPTQTAPAKPAEPAPIKTAATEPLNVELARLRAERLARLAAKPSTDAATSDNPPQPDLIKSTQRAISITNTTTDNSLNALKPRRAQSAPSEPTQPIQTTRPTATATTTTTASDKNNAPLPPAAVSKVKKGPRKRTKRTNTQKQPSKTSTTKASKPTTPRNPKSTSIPALLHLELTLAPTPYNITHPLPSFDPTLRSTILSGLNPPPCAIWKATIELPKEQHGTSSDAAAAEAAAGRFIYLDPGISRAYFQPEDVHTSMRRSGRIAARVQQEIENPAPSAPSFTKRGTKRTCPPCPEHCPPQLSKKQRTMIKTTAAAKAKKPPAAPAKTARGFRSKK